MSTRNLNAALEYARYGWAVFPLRPNTKVPLSLHGFHDATTDVAQITRWWQSVPNAGIGIATGTPSGLIVLDVDPRNGGTQSLAAIEAQYDGVFDTAETLTGGGGRHFYFAHPGKDYILPSAKPWPGIDIKAEGGYVAACPSIHPSGIMYRWASGKEPDRKALQAAPEWLISLLKERRKTLAADVIPSEDRKKLKQGSRNDGLASLAGTMQRRGMSFDAILAAILAENGAKCAPPLPEEEVVAIVKSVSRYAPDEDSTPQNEPAIRTPRMDVTGALSEDPPSVEWLLEGWIAKGDLGLISGDPGAGKSWLMYDLGLSGASGFPIWEHFAHEPFRVLMVDEENHPDDVRRRLYDIALARGIKAADLEDRLVIAEPKHGFSFRSGRAVRQLEATIEDTQPDLIIFDSMTAITTVKDEADPIQVRQFFHDHVLQLQRVCNSSILLVHHTNKGVYLKDRASRNPGFVRGSIDMIGGPDTVMLADSQAKYGVSVLTSLKTRRGAAPEPIEFVIRDAPNGGVSPVVTSGNPSCSNVRDLILFRLQDEIWVDNLFEKVQALSPNKQVTRSSFDSAACRLEQEGKIEKMPSDIPKRKIYRIKNNSKD